MYPKGPCSQIDIHRPQSTQIGTTLRPKYIYLDTWTLRGIESKKLSVLSQVCSCVHVHLSSVPQTAMSIATSVAKREF